MKLVRKKPINELAVKGEIKEFRISPQYRYWAPSEEADLSVQAINDNLTDITTECAMEVGGKIVRQDTGKLSQEMKDLIKERQGMKASTQQTK